MNKKMTVIVIVIAVLALAIGGAGFYYGFTYFNREMVSDKGENGDVTTLSSDSGDTSSGGSSSQNVTQQNATLAAQILGKWRDGADMSGYEFKENGAVEVTYLNIDLPLPIGTYPGSYTVDGDLVTISFSIYGATISNTYTASVANNTLTLVNTDGGDVLTYMRSSDSADAPVTGTTDVSTPDVSVPEKNPDIADGSDLAGSWVSSDGSKKYVFNPDGTAQMTIGGERFSGVYITDEDELTVQYNSGAQKISEEYEYRISDNTLTLEDRGGKLVLVRSGTTPVAGTSDELLGKWTDGSKMSGYEFKDGGIVSFTYINLEIPGLDTLNGNYTGSYAVDGNTLTISFSIYGATISNSYTYEVTGNSLKMTASDGNVLTYIKQ